MKAIAQLFLLLVISTLVTGKNLPWTANDSGRPVDDDFDQDEFENDPASRAGGEWDTPNDAENDSGST